MDRTLAIVATVVSFCLMAVFGVWTMVRLLLSVFSETRFWEVPGYIAFWGWLIWAAISITSWLWANRAEDKPEAQGA